MQKILEKKFSSFPFLFCRFLNMVIFEEFLAFDEVLDEVMQALDEAVAHLLPPPPNQQQTLPVAPQHVSPPQGKVQATHPELSITLRVNQTVTMKWTKNSLGETF